MSRAAPTETSLSEIAVAGRAGWHAGARPSLLFLTLLLGSLAALGSLAIDMYLPSFDRIAADLHTDIAAVQRTLAAYFVGLAVGQLFYGPASDRWGRKPPLYFGLALFVVASVGCALANSVHALVLMRFLQALGGCSAMVIVRAVVRDLFEARDAARMYSSQMLVMGAAPILAPLLGGWLAAHYGWRTIFWTLVLAGCLLLTTTGLLLRETLPRERRERRGLFSTVRLYRNLFRHSTFLVNTGSGALMSTGLFAYVSGSPFVFIQLFHVTPERFGLFFGANAFGLIAASQVNGWLSSRVDPRRTLRGGLAVGAAAGLALLVVAMTGWGGFVGLLLPLFVFVASIGFVGPNSTALAMAPHGKNAGNASALLGCLQFLLSGVGGLLVSLLHNGTAVPMAGVMAGGALAALFLNLRFARHGGTSPYAAEG